MKNTGLFIRLSDSQKALIESMSVKMGFKTTSEYVRTQACHPSVDLTRIENGINELEKKGLK